MHKLVSLHGGLVPQKLSQTCKLSDVMAAESSWQLGVELHTWRSAESCRFATFIYEKAGERLLRHFTARMRIKSSVKRLSGARRIREV
jgi:hypothetical protein